MKSGIYQIINAANGRRYIGSAVNLPRRLAEHSYCLRRGVHRNRKLQHSWNKHGQEVFQFSTVLICAPRDLLFYEQLCLDGLQPEYNIAKRAAAPFAGRKHTPEARKRLSESQKGYKPSPETIAKLRAARAGRVFSPETRAKIAASSKGRVASPETRAKIALSKLGNTFGRGNRRSKAA